jgi:cyclopropane-fatty-acyl-phospholipid synthase
MAFGASYARTLGIWSQSFDAAWDKMARLGFDERFRRLWAYYLAYCEAGFRTGSTDVVQLAVAPK